MGIEAGGTEVGGEVTIGSVIANERTGGLGQIENGCVRTENKEHGGTVENGRGNGEGLLMFSGEGKQQVIEIIGSI